jgi:hypothetical protein
MSGHLTALEDPIKGWIAGFLGLLIGMIGQEGIHAYPRFAYGSTDLAGGIGLLPALVGAFGFSEVLSVMKQPAAEVVRIATDRAPCEHLKPESRRLGAHELLYDLVSHFLVRGLTALLSAICRRTRTSRSAGNFPLGGS